MIFLGINLKCVVTLTKFIFNSGLLITSLSLTIEIASSEFSSDMIFFNDSKFSHVHAAASTQVPHLVIDGEGGNLIFRQVSWKSVILEGGILKVF